MEITKLDPKWELLWVDTEQALTEVGEQLTKEELISVDTETVGWDTGNERLCLIQIGVPSRKQTIIVDPLAVTNIKPLEAALSAKTPLVVIHNAAFEERQFNRYAIKIRGVMDTLAMARRLRPDFPNHTLQTCCKLLLDVAISKEEQASNWSARPLSKEQLKYARLDAELAIELYTVLAEMDAKLKIDPALSVPELMKALHETVRDKMALTKEISAELALNAARDEILREAIRTKLIEGAPPYVGEFGECRVNKVKRTDIDPNTVREEFPQLADRVIQEFVDRKQMLSVMKEYAIPEEALEKVLKVVGYNDRLTLKLANIV